MSMTIDLDGGYESNVVGEADAAGDPFQPIQSGYVTTASTTLRYRVGRRDRYLLGQGSGSVSQQQLARGLPSYRLVRGSGGLQATTDLGRRSRLNLTAESAYEPTFLFGAFDSLASNVSVGQDVPAAAVPTTDGFRPSLTAQRWLANRFGGDTYYNWTSRQRTTAGYDGSWMQPIAGPGLESRAHTATIEHSWRPRASTGIEIGYRSLANRQRLEAGTDQRLWIQTAEVRLRYERRLTPRKSLEFMAGGGIVKVDASEGSGLAGVDLLSPSVAGSVRLAVASAWGVSLSARRDVTVLYGLSPEPFTSDAALVTIDGTPSRRLTFNVTGGYSRGRARVGQAGEYDQSLVEAVVRYGFGTNAGLVVVYGYNDHAFRNVSLAPTSFPSQFTRNSVRIGLTFWLPLLGRF